jgi:MoaA/NifB/PqqE/SkfB family radical SAM enzyme
LSAIKYLQVEATTKCNAWCPGCGRNNGGHGLSSKFQIEDLDYKRFNSILEEASNLEIVDFCGTYGDAIAAPHIVELTELAKKYSSKIIVRTNGSLRNVQWWEQYADILKDIDHEVWFCLDGLEDTHSIYRQATDFNTIIKNATAFIQRGGTAVWQFIPWKHNEHQIKDCIKLSQQLGFSRFEFIKNVRKDFDARHYQTGDQLNIMPWGHDQNMNKLNGTKTVLLEQNCRHLSQPSVYLNASGMLSVCCFFNIHSSGNSMNELPNIADELSTPRQTCLRYCGI